MKNIIVLATFALLTISASAQKLKTHEDSISYALGVSIAETLKKSGITEYNREIFLEAVKAHLDGKAALTQQEADKLFKEEQKRITEAKAQENLKTGEKFLEENKKKQGVQTTASGLQYKHLVEGTGASPAATDNVTVHYHGTLADGTVFDSSVDRGQPATFGLNRVITGWTEGLQLMKEGGKTIFYIPANLAYGPRGQGKVTPNSMLIFEVELIKVEQPGAPKPNNPGGQQPAHKNPGQKSPDPKSPAPAPAPSPTPSTQPAKK